MIERRNVDRRRLREALSSVGGSLVVAGLAHKARVHIHVNDPAEVFRVAAQFGQVSGEKADDMQRQQRAAHAANRRVAIVTDSAADIPEEEMDRLDIHMVPARVHFGERSYLDKVGITPEEFFAELERGPHHPKTSQPPPGDFRRTLRVPGLALRVGAVDQPDAPGERHPRRGGVRRRADQHARRGAGDRQPERLGRPGTGRDVCGRAARRQAQAWRRSRRRRVRSCRATHTFGLMGSLEYAVRGGRVPRWVKRLADALQLMPVLGNDAQGRVRPVGVLFGRRNLREKFARFVRRRMSDDRGYRVLVGHANCEADGHWLLERLRGDNVAWSRVVPLGSALGAHGGPGMLVVGLQEYVRRRDENRDPGHTCRPRAGSRPRGALREPIHLSTTFERAADGGYPHGYSYTRAGNPNRASLETAVAALEGGAAAVAFASGSAATLAAFSLATPGGRIVCSADCYHGSLRQLRELLPRWGVAVEFVDTTDLDAVRAALAVPASLLWLESPSNPLLRVSDIAALAGARARERRAARLRQHLRDAGAAAAARARRRPRHAQQHQVPRWPQRRAGRRARRARAQARSSPRLQEFQACGGGVPSPFDCWLLLRSLATLPLRMRAQSANAQAVADFLAAHPSVGDVHYPGLARHPGHALAGRQMRGGYGAVVSFTVPGGAVQALDVVAHTRVFTRATSLGGLESLIEHRASMEGPESTTPANLIRLSVGLEHIDDLTADLDQALRR